MSEPTTEMIDRLYLELSQFTHATTKREAELQAEIAALREKLDDVVQACAPLQSGGDLSERVGMRWGESITTDGVRKLCAALREADTEIKHLRGAMAAQDEREQRAARGAGMVWTCDWPDDALEEIAALREAVRWVDRKILDHRIIRAVPETWSHGWDEWRDRPEVRRALEEGR